MSRSNRFTPGQILAFGHAKRGQKIIFRTPTMADVAALRRFINTVIAEHTFIGTTEPKSLKEEKQFVRSRIQQLKNQDGIFITAWVGTQLVGTAGIDRQGQHKTTAHIGTFGISVAKKFRSQGVGQQLALVILDAAKTGIPGIKIVDLKVFAVNKVALGLYKKLGFKAHGRLPQGLYHRGKYLDDVMMYKWV